MACLLGAPKHGDLPCESGHHDNQVAHRCRAAGFPRVLAGVGPAGRVVDAVRHTHNAIARKALGIFERLDMPWADHHADSGGVHRQGQVALHFASIVGHLARAPEAYLPQLVARWRVAALRHSAGRSVSRHPSQIGADGRLDVGLRSQWWVHVAERRETWCSLKGAFGSALEVGRRSPREPQEQACSPRSMHPTLTATAPAAAHAGQAGSAVPMEIVDPSDSGPEAHSLPPTA